MDKFIFSYPTKVYFGEGSAAQAFKAEFGGIGKNVMLAYGAGPWQLGDIQGNPAMREAYQTGKSIC